MIARLTEKQKRFADEYLIDLNATQAAIKSGYSEKTASVQAVRLLRNVNVQQYIQVQIKKREQRTEITQDRVIEELAKIGFSDISDYCSVEENGVSIKETASIDSKKIGAISSIKQGANGIEVKLYDKLKALELLGKHLGIFENHDNVDSVEDLQPLAEMLNEEDTDDSLETI